MCWTLRFTVHLSVLQMMTELLEFVSSDDNRVDERKFTVIMNDDWVDDKAVYLDNGSYHECPVQDLKSDRTHTKLVCEPPELVSQIVSNPHARCRFLEELLHLPWRMAKHLHSLEISWPPPFWGACKMCCHYSYVLIIHNLIIHMFSPFIMCKFIES